MLNMLVWKSRTETHADAVEQSLSVGAISAPDVKVLHHVQGIGIGFMLVESEKLEPVFALCSKWASVLTIEAHPVITEHAAHQHLTRK